MATIRVRSEIAGVDLQEMVKQVKQQMAELSDTDWKVIEADLWSHDDIAVKQGMARMWRGNFTLETTIPD